MGWLVRAGQEASYGLEESRATVSRSRLTDKIGKWAKTTAGRGEGERKSKCDLFGE